MRRRLTAKTIIDFVLRNVVFWFVVTVLLLAIAVTVRLVTLKTANQISEQLNLLFIDVLAGALVSFAFYFLVVFLPEHQKKIAIKRNLKQNYLYIKKSILTAVITGSIFGGREDLTHDLSLHDRLMNVVEFRNKFKDGGGSDQGYYAFSNYMSDDLLQFQEILLRLSHLKSQVTLALHNYAFSNDDVLERFHFLEMRLTRLERSTPGYDSSEPLLGFLFEIFSGWDMIHGFRDFDYILKMIEEM